MTPTQRALALCGCVAMLALALGAYRTYALERAELEHVTRAYTLGELRQGPHATRISARLTSLALRRGDHVVFELCTHDELRPELWRDALDLAVLDLDAKKLLLRVPLDTAHLAHARRSSQGACLMLGQGVLERSARYSVEATWPHGVPSSAVQDVPIYVRVDAKAELHALDRLALGGLGLALIAALLLSIFAGARATQTPEAQPSAHANALAWVGVAVGLLFAATQLPLFGATLTLLKGVLLLVLQVVVAVVLAGRLAANTDGAAHSLGLHAPQHRARAFALAVIAWPLLVGISKLALRLVPATGEAPIETFIAWPSGMLSAALLGAFLPLGEELLFRGYVYGGLAPRGRLYAASVSIAAFVLLHVQQAWGQWGALVGIACAGTVFTALRVLTGSTLTPALTHVAYNVALSSASIFQA